MLKNVKWNVDVIDSKDYDLSILPDNPNCPLLVKLFLQLPGLFAIPHTFFECMPVLEVLDLSYTNIVSLPSSISSLSLLKEFFLRDCSALIELPSQIGMLTKLKLFDIKGTEIMFIPKEMGNLKDLEVLRVSLSRYANYYIKSKSVIDNVIPRKMISELKNMKELSISVCPEAEWWEEEVNDIQDELCALEKLESLQWYLPTDKVLHEFLLLERNQLPIYANISNLVLTIGRHAQLTSCIPQDLKKKFEEFKKFLKWINAEGSMDDITEIIGRAEALFLSHHWTLKKLSTFNVKKMKYCLLAECSEMESLIEAGELDGEEVELRLLQYLNIHYMKKLKSICKGPIGKSNFSKLRVLALHTCPELTTIFTQDIAQNLSCLIEITVEDCPKVRSLITYEVPNVESGSLFPRLERIFLLDLPELVCIFGGLIILEKLGSLLIYSCRKLRYLCITELPHIEKIKGEVEWWNALECDKSKWENVFEPLKERGDLIEQLSEATNSLKHFHDVASPEAKDEEPLDGCGSGAHTSDFPFGEESQPGHVILADTEMEKGKANMIEQVIQDDITMAEGIRKGLGHRYFSLETLRLATSNFSDDSIIGRGAFGRVYRGQLYCGERVNVAVKRFDQALGVGGKEFLDEIIMLSGLKHANLVNLLGFCYEDGENILVYKYMPNKSLDLYLSSIALTWTQRLKICIGVARGLKYLHGEERVIHRDIKSSNILLDDNWNAKISDFGLVGKIGPASQAGTFGYMDPSYLHTGILSKESDVYSFGVVLLEVLCGRRSNRNDDGGVHFLPQLVKTYYKENKLDAIIHDVVRDQISAESLEKFSAIAYQCLSDDHRKRPPAAKIVTELEIALQSQEFENSKSQRLITICDKKDAVENKQKSQQHSPTGSTDLQIYNGIKLSGRRDVVSRRNMKDDPTQNGDDESEIEDEERGIYDQFEDKIFS